MTDVVGAMLVRNGQVLLGLRAAHKSFAGDWDIIGGHIETGETQWSALCRELVEEIGVQCVSGNLLDTLNIGDADRPTLLHVYAVSSWEGVLRFDRHLRVVAECDLGMRDHHARVGIGERDLPFAAFLQLTEQRGADLTLFAQPGDLGCQRLAATGASSILTAVDLVQFRQIALQSRIGRSKSKSLAARG